MKVHTLNHSAMLPSNEETKWDKQWAKGWSIRHKRNKEGRWSCIGYPSSIFGILSFIGFLDLCSFSIVSEKEKSVVQDCYLMLEYGRGPVTSLDQQRPTWCMRTIAGLGIRRLNAETQSKLCSVIWSNLLTLWPAVSSQKKSGFERNCLWNPIRFHVLIASCGHALGPLCSPAASWVSHVCAFLLLLSLCFIPSVRSHCSGTICCFQMSW